MSIYLTIPSGEYEGLVASQTEYEEQEKAQDLHETLEIQSFVQWSLRTTKEISAFVTTFAELIKEDKQPSIKSFFGTSIYLGLSA